MGGGGGGGGGFLIKTSWHIFVGIFHKKRKIISKIGRGGAVRLAVCVP